MKKLLQAALICVCVSACTSQYGNYAKISEADNKQMADDTANKLLPLYPPASTHFIVGQATSDAFGMELVKQLRKNGYAIKDDNSSLGGLFSAGTILPTSDSSANSHNHKDTESPTPAPLKPDVSTPDVGADKSMGYVVDQIGKGLYRITITINTKVLSRVYYESSGGIVPAGAWTRKE